MRVSQSKTIVPQVPCRCCKGKGAEPLFPSYAVLWRYLKDHPESKAREVHEAAGHLFFKSVTNTISGLERLVLFGLAVRTEGVEDLRKSVRYSAVS